MRKLQMTLLLLLFTTVAACLPSQSSATPSLVGSFDSEIAHWSGRFIPMWDWRYLKAQLYQESLLNPNAVNARSGATGIGQFLPAAWSECQRDLRHRAPRTNARAGIMCAAYYMGRMHRIWDRRGRTAANILPIAQSSYNAGPGRVIQAQRQCGGGRDWIDFADCLPREAREYPIKVRDWYYKIIRGE